MLLRAQQLPPDALAGLSCWCWALLPLYAAQSCWVLRCCPLQMLPGASAAGAPACVQVLLCCGRSCCLLAMPVWLHPACSWQRTPCCTVTNTIGTVQTSDERKEGEVQRAAE